jgi:hypothetical protein
MSCACCSLGQHTLGFFTYPEQIDRFPKGSVERKLPDSDTAPQRQQRFRKARVLHTTFPYMMVIYK